MPDDDIETAELLCSKCEGPVYFDPDEQTDPQACMCSPEERPGSWRIIPKSEAIEQAEAYI